MSTEIVVNKNNKSIMPNGVIESKLKVNKYQMDIIAIILAEIGKSTDVDSNLTYTITSADLGLLKDVNEKDAARALRDFICEKNKPENSMRLIGFDILMDNGDFEHYNWFTSVIYRQGIATFNLTPEIKKYLVDFKKSDQYKVYARLRYILPMKSVYSKRIYLMCREYISSGTRFRDTDWNLFIEKLGIPSSYSTHNIRKQILDNAVEEINETTDINISYFIEETTYQGGKKPTAIRFNIVSKETEIEDIVDEVKQEEEQLTQEQIKEKIKQLQAMLTE